MSDYPDTDLSGSEIKVVVEGVEEVASEFNHDLDDYPNFNELYELLVDRGFINDERTKEANISISVRIEVNGTFKYPGSKDDDDVARDIACQVESEIESLISGANMSAAFADDVQYDVDVAYVEAHDWNVS